MINLLLDRGANIEAIAEDETPLLAAVKYSKFAMAELLLARGANPNFQDSKGMTALHYITWLRKVVVSSTLKLSGIIRLVLTSPGRMVNGEGDHDAETR